MPSLFSFFAYPFRWYLACREAAREEDERLHDAWWRWYRNRKRTEIIVADRVRWIQDFGVQIMADATLPLLMYTDRPDAPAIRMASLDGEIITGMAESAWQSWAAGFYDAEDLSRALHFLATGRHAESEPDAPLSVIAKGNPKQTS